MKKVILLYIVVLLFSACEKSTTPPSNKFVIEAFLFAGEPIDDIYIKTTFPISEVDDQSTPISDASVSLIKNDKIYGLIPSDSAGFYHYPNTDLTVETGDSFELVVTYNDVTATATTVVPTPTTGLQVTPDTMFFPPLGPQSDSTNAIIASLSMDATWDNPNDDYYYLVVETVDTIVPIFPDFVAEFLARFRYVSEPTNENALSVPGIGFTSLGRHRIKVYHINQEYVDLYLNQEQDSRDLNEPPTNITNALGVFSAFNSQEAYMEVVRQ